MVVMACFTLHAFIAMMINFILAWFKFKATCHQHFCIV